MVATHLVITKACRKCGATEERGAGRSRSGKPTLTPDFSLCSLGASWIGDEFDAEPTCISPQPPLAGGQYLHGAPRIDAAVSRPRPGCAELQRWILSDLQLQPMA